MASKRILLRQEPRVETGAVQFGDGPEGDWPGLFIRGDNCIAFSLNVLPPAIAALEAIEERTLIQTFSLQGLKAMQKWIEEDVLVKRG